VLFTILLVDKYCEGMLKRALKVKKHVKVS